MAIIQDFSTQIHPSWTPEEVIETMLEIWVKSPFIDWNYSVSMTLSRKLGKPLNRIYPHFRKPEEWERMPSFMYEDKDIAWLCVSQNFSGLTAKWYLWKGAKNEES
jgi:hypothetical protein